MFDTLEATDSLAGRMLTLELWPLSLAKLERRGPSRLLDRAAGGVPALADAPEVPAWPRLRYVDLILRGGHSEIRTLSPRFRGNRHLHHIDTAVDDSNAAMFVQALIPRDPSTILVRQCKYIVVTDVGILNDIGVAYRVT